MTYFVVLQKLQGIVRDLQEIDKIRHKVSDIQVPLEVFDYIDTGRNPQLYTKDCMEKAVSKNEEVICFNIQSRHNYWTFFVSALLQNCILCWDREWLGVGLTTSL